MALQLAQRIDALKASDVREMLKITQRSEIISFAGGLPAPELLPIRELEEATHRVLQEEGARPFSIPPRRDTCRSVRSLSPVWQLEAACGHLLRKC